MMKSIVLLGLVVGLSACSARTARTGDLRPEPKCDLSYRSQIGQPLVQGGSGDFQIVRPGGAVDSNINLKRTTIWVNSENTVTEVACR